MRLVAAVLAITLAVAPGTALAAGNLCPLKAVLHKDGSISLDGALYSSHSQLKARLLDYKKHHVHCVLSFVADRGTAFKTMVSTIVLLQDTGMLGDKVGFLTEPDNAQ